jgi:hypothetical protein
MFLDSNALEQPNNIDHRVIPKIISRRTLIQQARVELQKEWKKSEAMANVSSNPQGLLANASFGTEQEAATAQ